MTIQQMISRNTTKRKMLDRKVCHIPYMATQNTTWIKFTRDWMRDNEITQLQMATRLGVSEGAFSHWINGRRSAKMETIQEVANIIGIPTSSLIGEDSPATSLKERELIENYNSLAYGDRLIVDALLKSLARNPK